MYRGKNRRLVMQQARGSFRELQFNALHAYYCSRPACFRYSIKLRGHETERNRNPGAGLAKFYPWKTDRVRIAGTRCYATVVRLRSDCVAGLMSERQRPRDKSERGNYGEPTQSREGLLRSPREREFSKYLRSAPARSPDRSDHRSDLVHPRSTAETISHLTSYTKSNRWWADAIIYVRVQMVISVLA